MNAIEVFPGLDARTYQRHKLHGEDQIWVDKNCYIDLWIELLHVLGQQPVAMLPFALSVDFEGDQWTFFKPSPDALRELYGVDVQELTVWRPLLDHAIEHLGAGRLISTEADAFFLPDTHGTDYRCKHNKTTILLANLNVKEQRLGYFHNAAYFELAGEDFCRLFGLNAAPADDFLPLFAEVIRIDQARQLPESELRLRSLELLRTHLGRRPLTNPVTRFAQRLEQDLPTLQAAGLNHYHQWAFACTRQAGAAFELVAANLRWLAAGNVPLLEKAAASFSLIAQGNKTLILKGARAVNSGKALAAGALLSEMAQAWQQGMDCLEQFFKTGQARSNLHGSQAEPG